MPSRLPGRPIGPLGAAFAHFAGCVLAIRVAHSIASGLLPGRLKPVRSQYPFIVLTATSPWIVANDHPPPYVRRGR